MPQRRSAPSASMRRRTGSRSTAEYEKSFASSAVRSVLPCASAQSVAGEVGYSPSRLAHSRPWCCASS